MKRSFTGAVETPRSFDGFPIVYAGVARIDDEVHRLAEFERSGPTYSLELLEILVRPYSRTGACGICDRSGNSL